jgi:hypothetical protein
MVLRIDYGATGNQIMILNDSELFLTAVDTVVNRPFCELSIILIHNDS